MANIHPLTGQTFRVTASNLVDPTGEPLTTPTVTATMTDPAGTVTAPTVTQSGETYYVQVASSVVGKHVIRFTAVSGNGTAKKETAVYVYDFAT